MANLYGPDDLRLATVYNNLASSYFGKGNLEAALKSHQQALNLRDQFLPALHTDRAQSLSNLAVVYAESNTNLPVAIEILREACEIYRELLGTEHRSYAISLYNLCIIQAQAGQWNESQRLKIEAQRLFEELEIDKTEEGKQLQAKFAAMSKNQSPSQPTRQGGMRGGSRGRGGR